MYYEGYYADGEDAYSMKMDFNLKQTTEKEKNENQKKREMSDESIKLKNDNEIKKEIEDKLEKEENEKYLILLEEAQAADILTGCASLPQLELSFGKMNVACSSSSVGRDIKTNMCVCVCMQT